jgi:hypothetical protein
LGGCVFESGVGGFAFQHSGLCAAGDGGDLRPGNGRASANNDGADERRNRGAVPWRYSGQPARVNTSGSQFRNRLEAGFPIWPGGWSAGGGWFSAQYTGNFAAVVDAGAKARERYDAGRTSTCRLRSTPSP